MRTVLSLKTLWVLAFPALAGWIVSGAAAWLVHHDSFNYSARDAGFGFISNAAETIFTVGPAITICVAVAFALPSTLVYLRRVASFSKAVALNLAAAIVFLCGLGSIGIVFAGVLGVMPLLWIIAMLWVVTHESNQHLQATPQ